jgi:hypothetical protein
MVKPKSTCPKWHFGQVGHGQKTMGGGGGGGGFLEIQN